MGVILLCLKCISCFEIEKMSRSTLVRIITASKRCVPKEDPVTYKRSITYGNGIPASRKKKRKKWKSFLAVNVKVTLRISVNMRAYRFLREVEKRLREPASSARCRVINDSVINAAVFSGRTYNTFAKVLTMSHSS